MAKRGREYQLTLDLPQDFLPPKLHPQEPKPSKTPTPKPGATDRACEPYAFIPIDRGERIIAQYLKLGRINFTDELYFRGYDPNYWWPSKARRYLDCPACARFGGRAKLRGEDELMLERGRRVHQLIAQPEDEEIDPKLMAQVEFGRRYLAQLKAVESEVSLAFRINIEGREIIGVATLDAVAQGEIGEFKTRMPQGTDRTHLAVQLGMESWALQARSRSGWEPRLTVLDLSAKNAWQFNGADYRYLAGSLYHLSQMGSYPVNPECPHQKLLRGRMLFDGFGVNDVCCDADWVHWQKARLAAQQFADSGKWIKSDINKLPTRIKNPDTLSFEQETEKLWELLNK